MAMNSADYQPHKYDDYRNEPETESEVHTAQHGVYLDDEHCCNKQFFRNHQSCCGAEKRFDRAPVDVNFLVEHGDLASEQAVTAVAHASIIPEGMHGNALERPWERANKGTA